ncbi:MAG: DUF2281 domain-containing protein [Ginsengibacter sp.]
MTDLQLYTEISTLPGNLKKEVQDFIELLQKKSNNQETVKERKFGAAKDFFKIENNFDEPLEDFKEYKY